MPDYGVELFKGRRWAPQLKISGINAPAEEYIVDPTLPPLGMDPRYPTTDQIVIPRGRIVAHRPDTYSYDGKAVITIADGVNNKPAGYTEANVLRQHPQRIQIYPHVSKQEFIELPYVQSVNDAYGQLRGGDRITAFFGSALSTTPNPMDKGRPVKWVAKSLYSQVVATASATVVLSQANLAPFTPRVVIAFDATGAPVTGTVTYTWNGSAWQATFPSAVKTVLYLFGQDVDQIAGEVVRVEPISSTHMLHGWLQWVTDNFAAWDYPPLAIRVPTTDVTNETPTAIQAGVSYQLANRPIAIWKPITVQISGSYVTENGTVVDSSTYGGWMDMPLQDVPYQNWTWGKYHQIDPWLGILTFSNNVTVQNVRVSYSYETSYRDGRLWGAGIYGLTDGSQSGLPGTPAHLDVPNLAGSLRIIIY